MYYPDQRYASTLTIFRREAMLPEEALGTVRVTEGKRVDIRDIVANGVIPARYVVMDALDYFGLRNADKLEDLLLVGVGDVVDVNQVIAGKSKTRGRRLQSPVKGIVSRIDEGRIIIQEMPEVTDVEAGVRGRVVHVEPGRGVIIEAVGAQTQGVWGNGRRVIATLRVEPEDGLENIRADALEQRYAGTVVLTRRPLTVQGLETMIDQSFSGVIAPSMDASLIGRALKARGAVLLTEGFGSIRMSGTIFRLLQDMEGQAVTVDAYTPSQWQTRTPEVIVNVRSEKEPPPPNIMLTLRVGMSVRVTREPYLGLTGQVLELPSSPVLLPNGLRVPCARVELVSGEKADVPVADLEVMGR
ncbi:MAG: hypothetical protein ACOCZH_00235 [Phototrophicaceae bacterium]